MTNAVQHDRPLRVLFVTHNYPRFAGDAAGSFLHRLALALVHDQHTVHVLSPAAPGYRGADQLDDITIDRVSYAAPARETLAYTGTMAEAVRGSWSGRRTLLQLLAAMRRAVREEVRRSHAAGAPYDIVHAHWWFPAGLVVRAAVPRRPQGDSMPALVVTAHGSDVRLASSLTISHPVLRWVARGTDTITAVSTWLGQELNTMVPARTVEVAPMPVSAQHFVPAHRRPAAGVSHDALVLFVGRLNAQKGAGDFLRAVARARSRTTAPFRCAVVGDGPEATALRVLATELGIDGIITWHGALPSHDLPALYQQATVTVMPSRNEGLGLVAVESQLCATPVIAYESGGLPDAVSPAHGGTLVPEGNIGALGDAVATMLSDPTRARSFGELGRDFVRERFTPEAVAARYRQLYHDAMHVRRQCERMT